MCWIACYRRVGCVGAEGTGAEEGWRAPLVAARPAAALQARPRVHAWPGCALADLGCPTTRAITALPTVCPRFLRPADPLQPLDAGTMALLGRTSKKHAAELQDAASGRPTKSRGKRHSAAEGSVLLPCVVPRAAADRAAQLLMLEADLRGRPELKALLERNDWPPPRHGSSGDLDADAADGAGGEPALGRHNHHLWQRLERAAGRVEGAADDAAAAAAKAGAPSEREQERERRRKARGRVLSAEELLVLGILSDPRWDYAGRTALG